MTNESTRLTKTNCTTPEIYWRHGTKCETLRVSWIGLSKGFYVRRQTATGYVTGFLTDRNGFGGPHIAQCFHTAQAACDAVKTKVKGFRFQVVHNV